MLLLRYMQSWREQQQKSIQERHLTDNKRIILSEVQRLTQLPIAEARKSCNNLVKDGLIGLSGKEYMLTAKVYDTIKSDVEYTQDTVFDM